MRRRTKTGTRFEFSHFVRLRIGFRHKFTLFLSMDGNFKQQLKMKNCDENDIELFIAFFANKALFESYIQGTSGDVQVRFRTFTLN